MVASFFKALKKSIKSSKGHHSCDYQAVREQLEAAQQEVALLRKTNEQLSELLNCSSKTNCVGYTDEDRLDR